MDVGFAVEGPVDRLRDVGVKVDRIDDFNVVAAGELGQGGANILETGAEILAPVPGHQDQPPGRVQGRKAAFLLLS